MRYPVKALVDFGRQLLEKTGLPEDRASVVADILIEGDLFGHTTHGFQLLGPYLKELNQGGMTLAGDPDVVADHGSAVVWDGRYLPGPWLVVKAMEACFERIDRHPVVTFNIRRSHHIACLAAYLLRAVDKGLVIMLLTSDPAEPGVTPYGGCTPVYTPDPIAAGFPTDQDPVLMDISMSTTSIGLSKRLSKQGRKLPGPWLIDPEGHPSDDPKVLFGEPPGALLPLGGMDLGYKGFALGLLVEALTSALGGHGRADEPDRWGASVFLQIIDPEAFGGLERFKRETGWLAEACRQARPVTAGEPVRLPGQAGLERRRTALAQGVTLEPTIMPALEKWAEKLYVSVPRPLPSD